MPDPKSIARQIKKEQIDPKYIKNLIKIARNEDFKGSNLTHSNLYSGDITSALLTKHNKTLSFFIKSRANCIICGLFIIPLIFEVYDCVDSCKIELMVDEGATVTVNQKLGRITGPADKILSLERVLLNFIQHMSGVATYTNKFVQLLSGSSTLLLDTRKTTPGHRLLEKYAITCGGAYNHRIGLYDRILVKDNHLAALDAKYGEKLTQVLRDARMEYPTTIIEVEIDHLEQILPALNAKIDIILLDNFSIDNIKEALKIIDKKVLVEASGGIKLDNISSYKDLGLDFISCGALVHQSQWVDIGLDFE